MRFHHSPPKWWSPALCIIFLREEVIMYKDEALSLGEDFYKFACKAIPEDCFEDTDDCRWVIPYIVNTAFACELFLKSFASDGQNEIKGHDWSIIFEKLNEEKKDSILNHPNFKGDHEFYQKLKEGGRLFEDWRYCFEKNKSRSVEFIFLDNFANTVLDLAKADL